MKYKFRCLKCRKVMDKEISMKDYDTEKGKQVCSCGSPMKRIIEWDGIAEGSGFGWFGKSTGNAI